QHADVRHGPAPQYALTRVTVCTLRSTDGIQAASSSRAYGTGVSSAAASVGGAASHSKCSWTTRLIGDAPQLPSGGDS
ncbi:MAG: hypothetical protein JWR63_2144, partial [Conexibacter sp.]|nr:hypothetical protein [Conexibacter sp.]